MKKKKKVKKRDKNFYLASRQELDLHTKTIPNKKKHKLKPKHKENWE